ncbi:MAG: MCE family protein [Mycobacterium sp.]
MKRTWTRRLAAGAVVAAIVATMSGCGWKGLNSLPLPGTEGNGPGAFEIRAQMPDVSNIQPNSRVRVGDVTVGHVSKIELEGTHALVTMVLNGNVALPANATAKVGLTTVFGSLHIELAAPTDQPPQGKLHNGDLIPLSRTAASPTPEQTLAALSLVLNGGGVGQAGDIIQSLSTAFLGREQDVRSLLEQSNTFAANLDEQSGDIIAATESFNNLIGKFAAQRPVLDRAVQTIPEALAVLNNQQGNLVDAATEISKFGALTTDTVNRSKENLVKELQQAGPVLESLANAGPALTRSLGVLPTYPFPNANIDKWQRGDSANLTAVIDLTLSRLDAGLFTGTRWECNLTQLELQWGRTIGQFPSPCLDGRASAPANPLTAPYRWDQGP